MIVDIKVGSHKRGFLSNVLASIIKGSMTKNIVIAKDRDNGELVKRDPNWVGFDNYNEVALTDADTVEFVVQRKDGNGDWYLEVTKADAGIYFLYNSAVSPYNEKELQDERVMYNKEGTVVSGYELRVGDIITISENGFDTAKAPVAQATVLYDPSTDLYVVQ